MAFRSTEISCSRFDFESFHLSFIARTYRFMTNLNAAAFDPDGGKVKPEDRDPKSEGAERSPISESELRDGLNRW